MGDFQAIDIAVAVKQQALQSPSSPKNNIPLLSSPAPVPTIVLPPVDEQLPVYVVNLSKVALQRQRWGALFPTVKPFFAIKALPDDEIIKTLAQLDTNFDCASAGEIDRVLGLGITADRIIFANPCKAPAHLTHAMQVGVKLVTADSLEEMDKIAKYYPGCGVLLRITVCDSDSKLPFSSKFGADEDIVEPILQHCLTLPLTIEGVSFHVGSGGCCGSTFREAIIQASGVINRAREMGHKMAHILDIGGGFVDSDSIVDVAQGVEAALSSVPRDIELMSEPGRWFASGCLTVAAPVIAVRHRRGRQSVHLSEGAYGMFSSVVWDKQEITDMIPVGKENASPASELSDLWGPSCDSMDFIVKGLTNLPRMEVGDWLIFPNMGAYTAVSATEFNGFKKGKWVYADDLSCLTEMIHRTHSPACLQKHF